MHKPYNNEKLNGMPRIVETRVFRVDPESGEETAIGYIPVFASGPHSSDRIYTPFGALEKEVYYDFSNNGFVISECGNYHAAFDEHHNITHEEYHYVDFARRLSDQIYTFENEYDSEGRLIHQTGWDKIGKFEHKTVAEFNDRGLMEHKATYQYFKPSKHYYLSIEEMFVYDDDGKLTQLTVIDETGRVRREETRVYDDDGGLLRETIRYHSMEEISRITYRKKIQYFINIDTSYCEKKLHYRSSQLDDHGNVVAAHLHNIESSLDFDDNIWKTERRDIINHFGYVYDEHGNWTRHDYYLKDGHYYATRKIEYYE